MQWEEPAAGLFKYWTPAGGGDDEIKPPNKQINTPTETYKQDVQLDRQATPVKETYSFYASDTFRIAFLPGNNTDSLLHLLPYLVTINTCIFYALTV